MSRCRPPVLPLPSAPAPDLRHADNLFPDVDSAVQAARRAFEQLGGLPLALRERMIGGMRRAARENAQVLARLAWRRDRAWAGSRTRSRRTCSTPTRRPARKSSPRQPGPGDDGMTLVEYAPYGVIGSITPSTNPTSTVICNAIGMVAAGNAVGLQRPPGGQGLHAT